MSIRIQNDGLTGAAASESSRTQDIVQVGNQSSSSISRGGGASDSVEISSLSSKIADAFDSGQALQSKRVSYLQKLYQSGKYQVDSASVSRALVSQALSSSGTEG
jgi:anti-sigma28 factor (negative regulator of flagellin synthesis)